MGGRAYCVAGMVAVAHRPAPLSLGGGGGGEVGRRYRRQSGLGVEVRGRHARTSPRMRGRNKEHPLN